MKTLGGFAASAIFLANVFVVSMRLCLKSCINSLFHLLRGLSIFSPARLTTASHSGRGDIVTSFHVILPGAFVLDMMVTSCPACFKLPTKALPMKPVPPPIRILIISQTNEQQCFTFETQLQGSSTILLRGTSGCLLPTSHPSQAYLKSG